MPLCSITTGSLESWHREKASHQNLVLYLYKSGSAEDPSRPRCAQCVAIQTTEMHPREVNQMHRLAWEATVSPALSSRQSSARPPPACIALPRVSLPRAGACTSSQPPHLHSHSRTPQECSDITWHKGRHM